jgi:hypothetical protein
MEVTKKSITQKKPIHRVMKSLQEVMVTMDMTPNELIIYHENKSKRCYGCNAKDKNYRKTCDCHKKKKCLGCHKLITQCMHENAYCDDPSSYDHI